MTVAELIKVLRRFPQDLPVAYRCCSEQKLLEADELSVVRHKYPRADGWIHGDFTDANGKWVAESNDPKQEYLMFPGN